MTYNVFGGTLSLTQSINQSINHLFLKLLFFCEKGRPTFARTHPNTTFCRVKDASTRYHRLPYPRDVQVKAPP